MINAANKSFPEPAVSEYVGSVFSQNRVELEWLANFLTGDEDIAQACVVDACAQAESANLESSRIVLHMGFEVHDPFRSASPATTDRSTFPRIHAMRLRSRRTYRLIL